MQQDCTFAAFEDPGSDPLDSQRLNENFDNIPLKSLNIMSGVLVLVKANKISVWYDSQRSNLILHAEGERQPNITDIHFERKPISIGLRFDLVGRHFPGAMEPPVLYEATNPFLMAPPLLEEAFIATSDQPAGAPYPISVIAFENKPELGPSVNFQTPSASQISMLGGEDINAIVDRTFRITHPSHVEKRGSISIDLDEQFVQLVDAGIDDTNVFWTLKALQPTWPSPTQVTLYVVPTGLVPSIYRKVYNVYIAEIGIPPDVALVEGHSDRLTWSFIAFVKSGLDKVQQTYPAAQIHRVIAEPRVPMKVDNPLPLTKLTLECQVDKWKLARLHSLTWGVWGPVKMISRLWDDVVPTPWTDHMMDVVEADKLLKDAGWKGAYTRVTLQKPVTPKLPSQPYYTFTMVQLLGGPSRIFVGLDDGKVIPDGQIVQPQD